MEFEEMKKIWNADSQQHAYAIDEDVLFAKVQRKKHTASRRVNRMEWFLITTNLVAGGIVMIKSLLNESANLFLYLMVGVLLVFAGLIYLRRVKRLKGEDKFDRSLLGHLDHAIRNAQYQELLSLMAFGYAIPVFVLVWIGAYHDDKSQYFLWGIAVFFVITIAASVVEHRAIHLRQRKRLESMKKSLIQADVTKDNQE